MDHHDASSETVGYLECGKCSNRFFRKSTYGAFDWEKCPKCLTRAPRVLKKDVTNDRAPIELSTKS